ncbi:efflux RND transporter periplasmic adaptor subunit [Pontibacter cellulosilyticus]|uniref:Efflux RND transporter periplasmic adaptor subunit n=1 Tax=Pontibacter cellulosilyticus TaxID=1720253 RepID=A0A923SI45_9BACT|nr:efflux RND transporter periplasmic adaptor subunit [Pontibacter cellulosilyticus]MBC5991256.1 efflux RND transporter periplasmic adaptor subunit [Pontibacter cellulosilyticus]
MNPRNKKYAKYLLVALAGLFLGWLIFGGRTAEEAHDHEGETAGVVEYTCSMHPQIRQNEPGKCPICGMDLIPVTTAGQGVGEPSPYVLEMTPEAIALANIQTTPVQMSNPENELLLTGTVALNEQKVSSITAKFPGRIERLYINFTGQEVKKGERLASIYSPELITAQRELQEAAKSRDIFPELYEAARTKLKLWNLSNSQIQRIQNANQIITNFDIYADRSGVVTERMVSVGDYVSTGSVLFEVANLSSVWIVLDAYETDLSWLQEGATVNFTVPGIPGEEFTAKVQFVTPVLDASTRAVEVRAEIMNPSKQLKPGMFVNARIKSSTKATGNGDALAVPRSAVLWTGKRSVVYVKVDDRETPAFEMREVTLGPRIGDMYTIQSGLSQGEQVVTNGVFAVDGAAQLSGNYSMMTAPANKQMEVPEAFKNQLTAAVDQYYTLKNALVASDAAAARKQAGNLIQVINKVDMSLLDGSTHAKWMQLLPGLKTHAEAIQQGTKLEQQRTAFSPLSDHLIDAVETFGTTKDVVYKQKCPMANNDKGAFWLSEQKEIRNPYFGEAMLTCGETTQTYREGQVMVDKAKKPEPVESHVH